MPFALPQLLQVADAALNRRPGLGQGRSSAARMELLNEYQAADKVVDPNYISTSPSWALAVIRLGRPLSFSRRTMKSIGTVVQGAFQRQEAPLIITDDCVQLTIDGSKRTHTKSLQATLRASGTNYLDRNVLLPNDWLLAWMWNNNEDASRVLKAIAAGKPANGFGDGLKFVGRVHSVHKSLHQDPSGYRSASYSLQAIGFEELDTQFFYDMALATASAVKNDISIFMAQLGLDFSKLAEQEQLRAGRIRDNADLLIVSLIDIILGKGVADIVNRPIDRAVAAGSLGGVTTTPASADLRIAPQANKEAPFAYLTPVAVATMLGRQVSEKSKAGVFGYADILDTLIGVQKYSGTNLYPDLNTSKSTGSRKFCAEGLKGTFLPVNPSFVNRPLYQLLEQFKNPAINEMYTALRPNESGSVVPTLVVRQIPFSTESMPERKVFPLTKFMSLPRWVIHPTMASQVDVGRSNATRVNMIHVYGEAMTSGVNDSVTGQMVRNPPIFDSVDIARSGIRAIMKTVNCALWDQRRTDGARVWMEAIADWSFGSQYTLNGRVATTGIQSPIAEGDNAELEGVVYHIEAVKHACSISPDGIKTSRTTLELSNGMPADQTEATSDFPRYPGFHNKKIAPDTRGKSDLGDDFSDEGVFDDFHKTEAQTEDSGDPTALTELDPGFSTERGNK